MAEADADRAWASLAPEGSEMGPGEHTELMTAERALRAAVPLVAQRFGVADDGARGGGGGELPQEWKAASWVDAHGDSLTQEAVHANLARLAASPEWAHRVSAHANARISAGGVACCIDVLDLPSSADFRRARAHPWERDCVAGPLCVSVALGRRCRLAQPFPCREYITARGRAELLRLCQAGGAPALAGWTAPRHLHCVMCHDKRVVQCAAEHPDEGPARANKGDVVHQLYYYAVGDEPGSLPPQAALRPSQTANPGIYGPALCISDADYVPVVGSGGTPSRWDLALPFRLRAQVPPGTH